MRKFSSVSDIVAELGGPVAVADMLDVNVASVHQWLKPGRTFPAKFFLPLSEILEDRGIKAPPEVLGQKLPPPRKRARAA